MRGMTLDFNLDSNSSVPWTEWVRSMGLIPSPSLLPSASKKNPILSQLVRVIVAPPLFEALNTWET